jgi:hypothetical protein
MAYRIGNSKSWMSDWTAPNGKRWRKRHPSRAEALKEERRQQRRYEEGLTEPSDETFAEYTLGRYRPEHMSGLEETTQDNAQGPLLRWVLGDPDEPTRLAGTRLWEVTRPVVRDYLAEILYEGVWFMARPLPRAWAERGLLVPGQPCPRCGGVVIQRPGEEGESRRGLRLSAVRECPIVAQAHRGPAWRPGQVGCGARAERRLASAQTARAAKLMATRILNAARRDGRLIFPGGVNPCDRVSSGRIRGPRGEWPQDGPTRVKTALGALSIEKVRASMPDLASAIIYERLYYGMHRPGDFRVAKFGDLERRIVSPTAGTTAWQLRFERQKSNRLRRENGRSTKGLVTLPDFIALGLRRAQTLLGAGPDDRLLDVAGLTEKEIGRVLAEAGRRSGVGHVYPYNGRLSVSCLRRRVGEDEHLVAKEGDHTVEVMRKFYTEACYDSLAFGPVLPLGELVADARPKAEQMTLKSLRTELAELEATVRSVGEAVLRMKSEGASVARVARTLGVGVINARTYLETVTHDPMQAALIPHHHKAPAPAKRLAQIRSNIDWLERHGVTNNPYPES